MPLKRRPGGLFRRDRDRPFANVSFDEAPAAEPGSFLADVLLSVDFPSPAPSDYDRTLVEFGLRRYDPSLIGDSFRLDKLTEKILAEPNPVAALTGDDLIRRASTGLGRT